MLNLSTPIFRMAKVIQKEYSAISLKLQCELPPKLEMTSDHSFIFSSHRDMVPHFPYPSIILERQENQRRRIHQTNCHHLHRLHRHHHHHHGGGIQTHHHQVVVIFPSLKFQLTVICRLKHQILDNFKNKAKVDAFICILQVNM